MLEDGDRCDHAQVRTHHAGSDHRSLVKNEGELINEGEVLVEIETEKIVCEVQSPASGTLQSIVAAVGAVAPVGGTIAVIG